MHTTRLFLAGLGVVLSGFAIPCLGQSGAAALLEARVANLRRPLGSVTRVQRAALDPAQRGGNLDGSGERAAVQGWALEANPFEAALGGRRLGPVDLVTGSLDLSSVDLSLPAHVPWTIAHSYSTGAFETEAGYHGVGWFQCSQPEVIVDDSDVNNSRMLLVYGADRYAEFVFDSATGDYRGVNGFAGVMHARSGVFESGGGTWTVNLVDLVDQDGTVTTFFGNTTGTPLAKAQGQVWRITDAGGHAAHVGLVADAKTNAVLAGLGGFDADGRIVGAFDSAGRKFSYTYSTIVNVGTRLTGVLAEVAGVVVGEVQYRYSSTGELITAGTVLPVGVGANRRSSHEVETYHYYATGAHSKKLQMVISAEGTRRFELAANSTGGQPGSIGWTSGALPATVAATDAALRTYASVMVDDYDTAGRVHLIAFDGDPACNASQNGGFQGQFEITYVADTGLEVAPYSGQWTRRALVKQPERGCGVCDSAGNDRTYSVSYFDGAGQTLGTVVCDRYPTGSGALWSASSVERSTTGTLGVVTRGHSPANIASFNFMAEPGTNPFGYKSDEGLITVFERVGTGAIEAGFVAATRAAKGTSLATNAPYTSSFVYRTDVSMMAPGATNGFAVVRPFVVTSREYREALATPTGQGVVTWEYVITMPPGSAGTTLVPRCVETREPVVTTGENGSGTANSTKTYFEADGTIRFAVSEKGRIIYLEHDPLTNLLTKQIFDANMDSGASNPVPEPHFGLATVLYNGPAQPALHLATAWTYDKQGRVLKETTSAGFDRVSEYGVFADQRQYVISAPWHAMTGGSERWGGAPTYVVLNAAGSAEFSAKLHCGLKRTLSEAVGTKPTKIPSITRPMGTWINENADNPLAAVTNRSTVAENDTPVLSMSTTQFSNDGSRALSSRLYHQIPASGSGAAGGDGAQVTDYLTTTYQYDALSRVCGVVDRQGNISKVAFDYRGLAVGVSAGVQGDETNIKTVAEIEYNANGRPIARHELLNGVASGPRRTTEMKRDYRERLRGLFPPEPPYALFAQNNRGDVVGVGLFGTDREGLMGSLPDPRELAAGRLALGTQEVDGLGRVYRESMKAIDPLSGQVQGGGGADGEVTTDRWFSPHGKVRMVRGETIEKYDYDRACNCVQSATLAGTQDNVSYSEAVTFGRSSDIVVAQSYRHVSPGLNRTTWEFKAFASPRIDGMADAPGGLLMEVPTPTDETDDPHGFNLSKIPGHQIMAMAIKPDEMGRPFSLLNFGDGEQGSLGDQEILCLGEVSSGPGDGAPCSGTTADGKSVRETRMTPDELIMPRMISPTPEPDEFKPDILRDGVTVDGEIAWLREIRYEGHQVEERERAPDGQIEWLRIYNPPLEIGEPADPCDAITGAPGGGMGGGGGSGDGEIRENFQYDSKRRLKSREVQHGELPPSREYRWYYGNEGSTDWATGIPSGLQAVRNNSVPVGFGTPDGRTTFVKTNAIGETVQTQQHILGPGAGAMIAAYDIARDGAGRPVTVTPSGVQASWAGRVPAFAMTYDGLGRVKKVRQFASGSVTGTADTEDEIERNAWSLVKRLTSRVGGVGGAEPGTGGGLLSSEYAYAGERPVVGGAVGWQGPRRTASSFAGGQTVQYGYDKDPGSAHAAKLGDPERDYLMGRVSRMWRDGDGTGAPGTPGADVGGADLGRYGYLGVGKLAWKEFDIAHDTVNSGAERKIFENPLWVPKRAVLTAGGDATALSGYVRMQNRFGEPLEDLWQSRVGNIASLRGQSNTDMAVVNGETILTANELHHDRLGWDSKGRLTTVRDDVLADRLGPSDSPWAYDVSTLYDCRDRIVYSGQGNRPEGGGAVTSGPGGGSALGNAGQASPVNPPPPRPARRAQRWDYDSPGNIKTFDDDYGAANGKTTWETAHDGGDKVVSRTRTDSATNTPVTTTLLSDELGNLTYDGRWHFEYDVLGRMIGAYRPSAANPQVRGTLFARFGYNAMGQRVTAAYDVDGAPDALGYPTGDGDLSNNPREVFAYDDKWQLVAVFNQGAVNTGTGARPPPVLKERYVYHAAGMRGLSLSQGLDRVVKRERFAAPDGNGVQALSDEVYYLQNRRGDVTELLGPDGEVKERVRYTVYGEAEAIDPSFEALDVNGDGDVNVDDLADFIGWWFGANPDSHRRFLDFGGDGEIDPDDLASFIGAFFGYGDAPFAEAAPTLAMDHGALSRPGIENRLGYCGYVWDRWLQVYHVRHRVYEPYHGRWYQPDPIGFAGGRNWFEYCGGQPSTTSDPMGQFGPIGAAVGAGIGAAIGGGMAWMTGGDVVAGAIGGAVGGAVVGSGAGLFAAVAWGAASGAAGSIAEQMAHNYINDVDILDLNWGKVGFDAAIGGATGGLMHLGGRQVVNFIESGLIMVGGKMKVWVKGVAKLLRRGEGGIEPPHEGGGAPPAGPHAPGGASAQRGPGSNGDRGGSCGGECFVAGTPVATAEGSVAIESLRVGDRVLTTTELSDTCVEASSWCEVSIVLVDRPDGRGEGSVFIDMLKPADWVKAEAVKVGSTVNVDLPEFGTSGAALVTDVRPCPPIKPGRGRVVVSTFRRVSAAVLSLGLIGGSEPIGVTRTHRIWSADRQEWVAAETMKPGERLQSQTGEAATVEELEWRPGSAWVYNIEVEGDHQYFVGAARVLVHNSCPYRGGAYESVRKPVGDDLAAHHMPADAASPLPSGRGPAIQMEPVHHLATSSYGGGASSAAYRSNIRTLLAAGEWRRAMAIEIRDVRRVAGSRYNGAIGEMLEYAKRFGLLDRR